MSIDSINIGPLSFKNVDKLLTMVWVTVNSVAFFKCIALYTAHEFAYTKTNYTLLMVID